MLSTISPAACSVLENFVRSAQVCQVIDASHIRIKLKHDKQDLDLWASFAMGNMPLPQVGDNVLVAGEDLQSSFIIGHFPAQPTRHQRFSVEQDKESGKTILCVPEGDLDLRSEQGSIRLQAAKNIELNSPQFSLETGKAELNIADAN